MLPRLSSAAQGSPSLDVEYQHDDHDDHGHTDLPVLYPHEEPSIELDTALTLNAIAEIALRRYPQANVGLAEHAMAEAEYRAGKKWLPAGAQLSVSYLSDKARDDNGAYENEVALSMPVWGLGERRAQRRYGNSALVLSASLQSEMYWSLSGQVRDKMWALTIARHQWSLATEQEQRLGVMLAQVELLHRVGDLSRADFLAAQEELALWRGDTLRLEAEFQDAVREYQVLTGLTKMPASIEEILSAEQHIEDGHPALQRARDNIQVAQAALNNVTKKRESRPALQLFWRDSRGGYESADMTSLGIGISIPLGRPASKGVAIGKANVALVSARAELLRTQRLLELQLHEAAHELRTLKRQLANSDQLIRSAKERHKIDKLAFELGEIGLREWLRRMSRIKEIERSHEQLLLQQGAAIAAFNQAVGVAL